MLSFLTTTNLVEDHVQVKPFLMRTDQQLQLRSFSHTDCMLTYLMVGGGFELAILAGSWCSLFPVRHRTFRPARRPMQTMSASDTLLKDKSKTWKIPHNVTFNTFKIDLKFIDLFGFIHEWLVVGTSIK